MPSTRKAARDSARNLEDVKDEVNSNMDAVVVGRYYAKVPDGWAEKDYEIVVVLPEEHQGEALMVIKQHLLGQAIAAKYEDYECYKTHTLVSLKYQDPSYTPASSVHQNPLVMSEAQLREYNALHNLGVKFELWPTLEEQRHAVNASFNDEAGFKTEQDHREETKGELIATRNHLVGLNKEINAKARASRTSTKADELESLLD